MCHVLFFAQPLNHVLSLKKVREVPILGTLRKKKQSKEAERKTKKL